MIDCTISDLEEKLDPALFLRIHRATLINLNFVAEVSSWFGGGMAVRLKDGKRTELAISRDRLARSEGEAGVLGASSNRRIV